MTIEPTPFSISTFIPHSEREESRLLQAALRFFLRAQIAVAELLYEHSTKVTDDDTTYIVHILAAQRRDGIWEGWLEFHPIDETKPILRTGQEMSQPSRVTAEYWALGLEPIYLQGALVRARERLRQDRAMPPGRVS